MVKTKREQLKTKAVFVFIFLMSITFLYAQQVKMSGTVTDSSKEPLMGVSIIEKGTGNGTVTDINGHYSLSVNSGSTIVFSYIGYLKEEKKALEGVLNVTLSEDTKSLEEVVVIGYGIQKKSSVTGAISQVKSEDMMNRTITRPEQALQGKTAGVQIIQGSAAPGSSPDVRIRGLSSNLSSTPLFVVDGRIAEGGISGIDPNDIESMEVLKDGASSAIYGIAAGNGVVLVSTKKGKAGKSSISYDFQTSVQNIARIPKVMNAEQYIDYMIEAKYLNMNQILQNWDFKTNTDWAKTAFENSLMNRHNLSFSGGSEMGNYYMALSYLNNNGYIVGDADIYERITATINASYNVKPWLEVGTNNQIEYNTRRSVAEGSEYGSMLMSVLQLDPLTPVTYAPDQLPDFMQRALADKHNLYKDENGNYYSMSAYQISDQYNPLVMRDKSYSTNKGFNLNGTFFVNFKPIRNLVVTSRFGYGLSGIKSYSFNKHFYANASVNQQYNQLVVLSSVPINYMWENFANYTHSFGRNNLNAMIGTSMRRSISYGVTGVIQGNSEDDLGIPDDPLFAYPSQASKTAVKTISGGEERKISWFSTFGRITYDYANKYFAQASLRRDGADISTMPLKKRYGYFPAASVGWTISNEEFFSPLQNYASFLKLRASWGQNGSASMLAGAWSWNPVITHTTQGMYGQESVLYPFTNELIYTDAYFPNVLGNTELNWERSEQLDFGFDARFFKDRLTLGFDYFNKKTKDLIISNVTLSTIVGNTASPINAGSIENKGVEIELGWQDNISKDFRYSVKGNIATLNNKVISIHESLARINGSQFHTTQGVTVFEPGYPAWYIRGYQVDKIDAATGNPVFKDRDGNNIIDDNDKAMIGKPMPDFTYGITLTAAYKGFDLTVFGTGAYGNDIMLCLNRGDRLQANMLKMYYDNRWTSENSSASMPRPGATDIDKYWLSDANVYDGSFFRIKQIQLGYTIPKNIIGQTGINNVRAYCSLDDYFTITSYPGFDPETVGIGQGMGLDKGSYPSSKKVVFGINITF